MSSAQHSTHMYIDTYIRGCSIQQCSASAVVATVTAGALSLSLSHRILAMLPHVPLTRTASPGEVDALPAQQSFHYYCDGAGKECCASHCWCTLFNWNNALKHPRCWLMPSVVSCCLSTQMTLVLNSVAAVAVTNTTCTQFTLSAQSTPLNLMTR